MKNKFIARSLRIKTLIYFLVFAALVLFLVWITQVVMLESTYLEGRKRTLKQIGEQVYSWAQEDEDFTQHLSLLATNNSINIYIVDGGQNFYYANDLPDGQGQKMSQERFNYMLNKIFGKEQTIYKQSLGGSTNLIYASKIKVNLAEYYLYLFAPIEPVAQTANLLKNQLTFITAIVIFLSFLLAYVFSAHLSRPVLKMSRAARRLAKRDFSVNFEGSPYSEINELAQTLNYAKTELMQSDQIQKNLIANVSHDLKTPLTMIKAYAEMIRDISGEDKVKREKCTQIIIGETDRLTALVNDILSTSKAQKEISDLIKLKENLSSLIMTVAEKFIYANELKGYTIKTNIAPDLFCYMGKESIVQAVYNLIANAINYTGQDKVVEISLAVKDRHIARLSIKDTGSGIPPERLGHIWDRYYRIVNEHKRPVAGSGLGLSIVKTILDAHSFKFGVNSTLQVGSIFYIDFPLAQE